MSSSGRNDRNYSLRSTITVVTLGVVFIAFTVVGALVLLRTVLDRSTSHAVAAAENVRLAQEAEIDLLLHTRAHDVLLRRDIEERMRRRLIEAREFVTTEEEAVLLDHARDAIAAYIDVARSGEADSQDAAYLALERLVGANVAQARNAQSEAKAWSKRADLLAGGVVGLLLVGATMVLLWLEYRAFAPVFSLATAMDEFGRGEHDVRAPEAGPAELREMSRRFNQMAGALAAQRQAQLAFLGGVAHDLRNPLSVLKLALALVPADKPLPPEERLRPLIDNIARQIARLERMAGDFLDLARIQAGEFELQYDHHDARGLLEDVVRLFEGSSSARRIQVNVPADEVPISCDSVRIEQVLTNLISNAMKYSPPEAPIELTLREDAERIAFIVTDRGIGIAAAEKRHLFEPFRRLDQSKQAVSGAGLGLFIVRRIIEAHAGTIDVTSTPGVGSTFTVELPRGVPVLRSESAVARRPTPVVGNAPT